MSKHTATESLFAKLNQHTDGDSVIIPKRFFLESFKAAKIAELEQLAEARLFGYDSAINILQVSGQRLTDPLLSLLTMNDREKGGEQ
jgi:hypothetical protein